MTTETLTISVDPAVAVAYRAASPEAQRKLDLLVNLRLREATSNPESLEAVIAELSQLVQQRGLTPEILQSILDER
jgi:hypothetical protein